jgi:adenosylmethionine-8-amino-7-oxononanoate aminotransferase
VNRMQIPPADIESMLRFDREQIWHPYTAMIRPLPVYPVVSGIGVIELKAPVDMATAQKRFVERGVWIWPFGRLVYTMPPLVIQTEDLSKVTKAMVAVASMGASGCIK